MNKEIDYLKEHLYEIYKYKKSMKDLTYDMDLEHLLRTCKALNYSQKENERLNNIISEALGIANERINYYYHNKNDELLKEWEEIFEKLVKRDTELKGDNK